MCLQNESNKKARQRMVQWLSTGMAMPGYALLALTYREDIEMAFARRCLVPGAAINCLASRGEVCCKSSVLWQARGGQREALPLMPYPATGGLLRAGLMQAGELAGFAGNDEVGMSRYWHIHWL
ncbi:MAG: hypothetical protein ACKOA4_07060 [Haliscomenobacter sp.]